MFDPPSQVTVGRLWSLVTDSIFVILNLGFPKGFQNTLYLFLMHSFSIVLLQQKLSFKKALKSLIQIQDCAKISGVLFSQVDNG